jgi:hypothetical protein
VRSDKLLGKFRTHDTRFKPPAIMVRLDFIAARRDAAVVDRTQLLGRRVD